jgi:predicted transposase/invertase (TIGR01784 family)
LSDAKREGIEEGMEKGIKAGMEKGRKEGLEEGIKKERKAFAAACLKKGLSPWDISELTGLTVDEIRSLDSLTTF